MPILNVKNYFIDGEEEIPQKYMEMIEQQLETEEIQLEGTVTPGKRGKVIKKSEMKEILEDGKKLYFGHGTPASEEIIEVILEEGLKVKNPEAVSAYDSHLRGLTSTTIEYGMGEETLFYKIKDELDNWPHKNSRNIIIASTPLEYALPFQLTLGGRDADLYEAFYTGNEEDGYKLRPEFIMGVYNADTQTFTKNENFYENLPENQRTKLFEEIARRYINSYAELGVASPEEMRSLIPLGGTDLEIATAKWYKVQLGRLREEKAKEEATIASGEELEEASPWIDIDAIAEETRQGEFDEATRLIRDDITQERENGKENIEEGWSVEDDW